MACWCPLGSRKQLTESWAEIGSVVGAGDHDECGRVDESGVAVEQAGKLEDGPPEEGSNRPVADFRWDGDAGSLEPPAVQPTRATPPTGPPVIDLTDSVPATPVLRFYANPAGI